MSRLNTFLNTRETTPRIPFGQRQAMAIVVRSSAGQSMGAITERVDDGTGQDLKFSARHLTRQFNAQQNELLSQNHTRYTSNILINYF